MKKYIQSMMAFAAIVSFASCSSEDNNTTIENESATKVMTFTATQEGDEASTKAILSGTNIHWESNDQISIFDGTNNNQFTLTGGAESTSGKFSGEAIQSGSYTAVYPSQENASLSGNDVTNVTLPATQYARDNSFDKNAALMMAQSDKTTLTFKNAVGYVKVTPQFDCSKIELEAADGDVALAGTGTLSYNNGEPTITFTSGTSSKITLVPKVGNTITAGTYYIAVPAVSLKRMWSISFTTSDGTVYTRKGAKPIEFQRSRIINLGEFNTDGNYWYDEHRGIVKKSQEVDLGLTILQNETNYKVIFTNANLTATGLAENETDYGDYFAWGATEPWYTSYTGNTFAWKDNFYGGYTSSNYDNYINDKSIKDNNVLNMEYDAARKILGGDWQIPTQAIWEALVTMNNLTKKGFNSERKGYEFVNNSQTLLLPKTGEVSGNTLGHLDLCGRYWSGTFKKTNYVYYLYVALSEVDYTCSTFTYYGLMVRPVRLVEVP